MKPVLFILLLSLSSSVNYGNLLISPTSQAEDFTLTVEDDLTKVIEYYLSMKDALVEGNASDVASIGRQLSDALVNFEKTAAHIVGKKIGPAIKATQKIVDNADNLGFQRKQFEILSAEIQVFAETYGTAKTLYEQYCPMKKASWLSDSDQIRNPYYGDSMLKCGYVKETIEAKE